MSKSAIVCKSLGMNGLNFLKCCFSLLLLQGAAALELAYCQSDEETKRERNGGIHEERIRIWQQWADLSEDALFAAYSAARDPWLRNHIPSILPLRVEDGSIRLSAHFGNRIHPITGETDFHSGIDLAAKAGQPVYATAQGMVAHTGSHPLLGMFIIITHGGMYETWYGHLSKIGVEKGQLVYQADVIGSVGSTGRSTSPHLHYTVKRFGKAVDADKYLFLRYGLID
jgi:murein DD-endopeptidase MepM/ murein hydrolase activator NlpD